VKLLYLSKTTVLRHELDRILPVMYVLLAEIRTEFAYKVPEKMKNNFAQLKYNTKFKHKMKSSTHLSK
jgi:hypothetical protein